MSTTVRQIEAKTKTAPSKQEDNSQEISPLNSIESVIGAIDQKEIVAIGIGVATVIGLSVIGTPVAIVAGTGAVVWFTARALAQTLM